MNKNLTDPTICYICLEHYTILNKPLVLMCGHTFCESCLKIIWNKKKEIQCSYCKSITTAEKMDDIIVNYSVLNTIEFISAMKSSLSDSTKSNQNNQGSQNNLPNTSKDSKKDEPLSQQLSSAITKFISHNCNHKDTLHFTEDRISSLKICMNCFSLHCNDCSVTYQQTQESSISKSKCIYCEYLHPSKKEFTFDGENINISAIKTGKKATSKQGNKFYLESRLRSSRDSILEDYDDYVGSSFENFKKDEINKFSELMSLYNQYMHASTEESLKILLEEEIQKAKKKFADFIAKLKKEEEYSILRMNMAFERKMQDFLVLSKEQKGLLAESEKFTSLINELHVYKKFSPRQKVSINRIYNIPLLIYEIKEFGNEAEARIEAFKEVSTFKVFENKSTELKEGLFMIELRENLANCVRLSNLN